MNIINKSKIWLSISSILVIVSVAVLVIFGFKYGIDFTGGSLLEVRYLNERPQINDVRQAVSELAIGDASIQMGGGNNIFLRFQEVNEEKHQEILQKLDTIQTMNNEKSKPIEQKEENGMIGIDASGDGELNIEEIALGKNIILNNIEELRFESVGPSIGQ